MGYHSELAKKRQKKAKLYRDPYAERSKDAQYTAMIDGMRSVDGRDGAKGGSTRSVSAELRQRPDRETQKLMKQAEKGDPTAAAELAKRWKNNN